MGRRGPKSKHPSGTGYTTSKGYHRIHYQGRLRMAHVVVWEQYNGPLPAGFDVHHTNGDKSDNQIENLSAISKLAHKRTHSGCELRKGEWWKPCSICGERKRIDKDNFYLSREGSPLYGKCRPCHIQAVVSAKQERRARMRSMQKTRSQGG